MTIRSIRLSLALFILFFASQVIAGNPLTTVILVRHAEKASETDKDPGLSAAGRARAERILQLLKKTKIDAIYTSQYIRTKETSIPIAKHFGIHPVTQDASDSAALVKKIQAENQGQTIFVAGHSNTVNEIAHLLGGPEMEELDESEYDNMFVVTFSEPGNAKVLHLKF